MKISINQKAYQLKFGFGMLRKLGELNGLESYDESLKLLQAGFSDLEKLSFKQEDIIRNIIYAAALNAEDDNADNLQKLDVMTFITSEPKQLEMIVKEIENSFPSEGKQTASKKTRKPKTT